MPTQDFERLRSNPVRAGAIIRHITNRRRGDRDGDLDRTSPGSRLDWMPLMLGLGNSTEKPAMFSAGLIGQELVSMSGMAHDLYEWAHMPISGRKAAQRPLRKRLDVLRSADRGPEAAEYLLAKMSKPAWGRWWLWAW